MISRQEAEFLLGTDDGNFLVRESNNPPGSATLAIKFFFFFFLNLKFISKLNILRFSNETKNYKMYYDGAFYVGDKRFDSVSDLVHDGLISFYIEKHASNYIAMMSEENNYSESPYVASRTALLARQKRGGSQTQIQPPSSFINHHQQQLIMLPAFPQQPQITPTFSFHNSQSLNLPQTHLITNDKENRSNSLTKPAAIINSNILLSNNNSIKSNSIFDRFDIMNSEKQHKFKPQNFKGPHWCDFCLNFMWGLVSQGVKCQDCGFQAHKKCSERTPPDCEPQMRFIKRIFGVDLTTLVKATNSIRPIIVEKCVEEIEKRKGALESEGLYRVSGFNDAIEELRLALDRGDNVDLSDVAKYNDIHLICSLLKLYLRQLPIPLITFEVYNRLIDTLSKIVLILTYPSFFFKFIFSRISNSKRNKFN